MVRLVHSGSQTVKHEIWIIINRRTIEAHSFSQQQESQLFSHSYSDDVPSLQPRGGGDIFLRHTTTDPPKNYATTDE